MNEFYKEIIISIFDKGLLALVLVLVGYYFNKKLEKFRINSNYRKALEEKRISAYHDLSIASQKYGQAVGRLYDFMKRIAKMKSSGKGNKELESQALSELDNMNSLRELFFESYMHSHIFLSDNLASDLLRFMDTTNSLSELFSESTDNLKLLKKLDNIDNHMVDIVQQIIKEINKEMV